MAIGVMTVINAVSWLPTIKNAATWIWNKFTGKEKDEAEEAVENISEEEIENGNESKSWFFDTLKDLVEKYVPDSVISTVGSVFGVSITKENILEKIDQLKDKTHQMFNSYASVGDKILQSTQSSPSNKMLETASSSPTTTATKQTNTRSIADDYSSTPEATKNIGLEIG